MQLSAPASIDNGDQPFPPDGLPGGLAACTVAPKCASRPAGAGTVERLATIGARVTAVAHEVRNELHCMHASLGAISLVRLIRRYFELDRAEFSGNWSW